MEIVSSCVGKPVKESTDPGLVAIGCCQITCWIFVSEFGAVTMVHVGHPFVVEVRMYVGLSI